jgi:basic amino acid/polyamine antiporter, APA family
VSLGQAASPDPNSPKADGLPRGFGLLATSAVVVSSMVGGGILTTSGIATAEVGSHWAMLTLWIVGGIVALCGALTLAELAAALPKAGGEYAILAEAMGPLAAFLAGWVSLWLGFAAPIAASAAAAVRYLVTPFTNGPAVALERTIASLAIIGFAVAHLRGRKEAGRIQATITAATIATLVAFIIAGLCVGLPHRAQLTAGAPPRFVTWLSALVLISYSYTGWNGAAYLAGEVKEPRRLPVAIVIGTLLVIGLYLGMNVIYSLAVPAEELVALSQGGTETQPVEAIAELSATRLFGATWSHRWSVAFSLLLFGSVSALQLTGARIAFAMARAGQFPRIAGRLSKRAQSPAIASALLTIGALLMLWSGRFDQLIVYSGVGLALFSLLSIGSVFVLRATRPSLHRPFRVPLYPIVPALYLFITSALVLANFAERPTESCLSVATILVGVPIFLLTKKSPDSTTVSGE